MNLASDAFVFFQNVEFFDVADDSWNFATSSFNPFQCYLAPLAVSIGPVSFLWYSVIIFGFGGVLF